MTCLDYPYRRFLFTAQYSLCPHNTSGRVYRPIQYVYRKNMGAMRIRVLLPDAELYMSPRVATTILSVGLRIIYSMTYS